MHENNLYSKLSDFLPVNIRGHNLQNFNQSLTPTTPKQIQCKKNCSKMTKIKAEKKMKS